MKLKLSIERARELMRIAADIIEENIPDATVPYDGTVCDGICLAEDLRTAEAGLDDAEMHATTP